MRLETTLFWCGKTAVGLMSLAAVVAFLGLALVRLRYPYELEWIEGEMLVHVWRLTRGQPLFTAPSIAHTPLPYAPLYYVTAAALSCVTGVRFATMRGVSIAATVATFVLLALLVKRETKSRVAAALAVGTYAASFRFAGAFFDVGRCDALFIMLSLGAIFAIRSTPRTRDAAVAGVWMALAILTKQTAVFLFAAMGAHLLVSRRKDGLIFAVVAAGLTATTSLALHVATQGWSTFFVWNLLFQHEVVESARRTFVTDDVFAYRFAIILVILAVWRGRPRHQGRRWITGPYAAAALGLVVGAWTGKLHSGGYSNVLMPLSLAMSLLIGLAVGDLTRDRRVGCLALGLAILELNVLTYDVRAQLPTAADVRTGDRLIAQLRAIDGNVWLTRHSDYALAAGKPGFAGQAAIDDVLRARDPNAQSQLRRSIGEAIHRQEFAAIVLDQPDEAIGFPDDWQDFYQRDAEPLVPDDGSLRPIVNRMRRPAVLYRKRPLPGG
jgi:hypothetical protein